MFLQWSYPALACHKISSDRVNTYSDTASTVAFVDVFLRNGFGSFYFQNVATTTKGALVPNRQISLVCIMGILTYRIKRNFPRDYDCAGVVVDIRDGVERKE
ncbi:hypothetical protein TNIN_492301 [Trichonephila inaurata madagascariensis]|uniref:Uncharacterized protein n=1 Tax=Trichonephila inaurata madagascariensis TaxID=2747483 RepID=A0A8X6JW62_9ARAC|nr:hypothetical protein TNIN_492301 [Trichonephila inaurata madagascariensis]